MTLIDAMSDLFWGAALSVGRALNALDDLRCKRHDAWSERCERLGRQVAALDREVDVQRARAERAEAELEKLQVQLDYTATAEGDLIYAFEEHLPKYADPADDEELSPVEKIEAAGTAGGAP